MQDVLRRSGLGIQKIIPAKIFDFELIIRPRVNLVPRPDSIIYGAIASLPHRAIRKLYQDLQDNFTISYQPYPVTAFTPTGSSYPALCYVSHDIEDADPDPKYVDEPIYLRG